jgi:hypothetical protein
MSKWTWSVGTTTAGRQQPTLDRMLSSLAQAGWEWPRLFADADAVVPQHWAHLPTTHRDVQLGAFPNWLLALAELALRDPHADAYLLCQDDVVFCRGLRDFLERNLWPSDRVGVVSLHCPSHYARGKPPGFHLEDRGWDSWGAQAYLFPNNSVFELLAASAAWTHRKTGPANGSRNIDSVVGQWCRGARLPYYVHAPSLAEHIGNSSTLYGSVGALFGKRRSADFIGEDTDLTEVSEFT